MVEKIEINLIPTEYVIREKHFSIDLNIMVPVLISLGLICSALIWLNTLNSLVKREESNIANIEREIEVNKTIQKEIADLQKKQSEMQVKVMGLKSINVNRAKWVDAFELYADILPENTWFTGIEESETGVITISGITEADAEVGQIMSRLFVTPSVSGINLVEMKDAGRDGKQKSFSVQHSFVSSSGN